MTEDFGNNRSQATPISIRNIPQVLKNTIGGGDRADFLCIKLSTRSQLHSHLSYPQANADLTLLNSVGEVVEVSRWR
ncbi:MAG: hypothetical protein MUF49_29590, partial [Oculatellaceae cyanobacterium Prado106]|nr:hypothetical protein [Oculatellaceae cyanobacterium Prado106]